MFYRKMKNKNRYEIIILGRGGQGAKTSAELLVQAALLEGKQIQAFPEFGPERSGAPVRSFVRISTEPIRTHETVTDPDCVLVLDDTLLEKKGAFDNLTEGKLVIVNSKKEENEIREMIGKEVVVSVVDASGMSKKIIGQERPNTVILGRFVSVSKVVEMDSLIAVFSAKYESKIGKEMSDKNVEAIRAAYNEE